MAFGLSGIVIACAIRLTRGEILYHVVAEAMQKMAGVFDHLSSAVQ
ncbi:hypothetical protein [Aquitalea denitrificans]|nr:hypothetical protein [Aquitalea denitrificans]